MLVERKVWGSPASTAVPNGDMTWLYFLDAVLEAYANNRPQSQMRHTELSLTKMTVIETK